MTKDVSTTLFTPGFPVCFSVLMCVLCVACPPATVPGTHSHNHLLNPCSTHSQCFFLFVCFFIREKKDLTVGEMVLPLPGVNVYEHSLLYGQLGQAAEELLDCWLVHESNEQIYPTLSRR